MRVILAKQNHDSKTEVSSHKRLQAHPTSSSAHPILRLQRTVGNQAVLRLLQQDAGKRLPLQPKLTVNTPGDAYEQEAHRVVEQMMRMPDPRATSALPISSRAGVQRECAC